MILRITNYIKTNQPRCSERDVLFSCSPWRDKLELVQINYIKNSIESFGIIIGQLVFFGRPFLFGFGMPRLDHLLWSGASNHSKRPYMASYLGP